MTIKSLALTALALTLVAAPVLAEDTPPAGAPAVEQGAGAPPPEGKGGPRSDEQEKRSHERFQKTDTDHDGFLSKDEMEAEHKARLDEMFTTTDADHDGKLSPGELKKGREAMREKFRQKFKEHGGKGDNSAESPAKN